MTARSPLYRDPTTGKIEELGSGDTILGSPAGTNGTDGNDGGAVTIRYTFSTTTTDADPGAGLLRLDNATQNTATKIYADLSDSLGSDWTSVLDTFDDSTNTTVKGAIRLVKKTDATKFLTFNVTAVTSASGYRKITVTNTGYSAASPFSNGDTILLCFDRAGDKGVDGADGTDGSMSVISKVVTSGSQSTITFSSIPGTYTDLLILFQGRDTNSGGSGDLNASLQMNGDTTSGNYDSSQYILGTGSTASSNSLAPSSAGGVIIGCPGVASNANAVAGGRIELTNYAGTTFHKTANSVYTKRFGSGPTRHHATVGMVWKSTAAITSLKLTAGGTAFVDGTTATLYGIG